MEFWLATTYDLDTGTTTDRPVREQVEYLGYVAHARDPLPCVGGSILSKGGG